MKVLRKLCNHIRILEDFFHSVLLKVSIFVIPSDRHSELFLDEVDTNEDLSGDMNMVDSGLEDAENKMKISQHILYNLEHSG